MWVDKEVYIHIGVYLNVDIWHKLLIYVDNQTKRKCWLGNICSAPPPLLGILRSTESKHRNTVYRSFSLVNKADLFHGESGILHTPQPPFLLHIHHASRETIQKMILSSFHLYIHASNPLHVVERNNTESWAKWHLQVKYKPTFMYMMYAEKKKWTHEQNDLTPFHLLHVHL